MHAIVNCCFMDLDTFLQNPEYMTPWACLQIMDELLSLNKEFLLSAPNGAGWDPLAANHPSLGNGLQESREASGKCYCKFSENYVLQFHCCRRKRVKTPLLSFIG